MQQVLEEPPEYQYSERTHHKQSADTSILQNKGLKNQDKGKKEKCGIIVIFPVLTPLKKNQKQPDFQQTAVISNYDTSAWPPHLSKVINSQQCFSSFQLWSWARQKPNSISHFTAYLWGCVHKLTSAMLEQFFKKEEKKGNQQSEESSD